ncbi:hypothetical protein LB577_13780 [Mesorhizobium sp. B283B1A]|uniref:hypothetical protein n=1 Tax=Mesorhizobium TaxID=68287 RepID=UPI001CD06C91|nr:MULTISPECIES: hypothetical protein [Mesorhizobium]MCA0048012.1 hypothetical protein [Mesorhizobium sp. B283B1A]UQS63853.1 hypothetical protein M5D98_27695 [Mesorhizobium opportunistum]
MKRKLTARCPIRFGPPRFNGGKAAVEGFVHRPVGQIAASGIFHRPDFRLDAGLGIAA